MTDAERLRDLLGSPLPLKASDVVEQLTRLIREHGDLPVILADRDAALREIVAYDADGNTHGKRTEFGLHGW